MLRLLQLRPARWCWPGVGRIVAEAAGRDRPDPGSVRLQDIEHVLIRGEAAHVSDGLPRLRVRARLKHLKPVDPYAASGFAVQCDNVPDGRHDAEGRRRLLRNRLW